MHNRDKFWHTADGRDIKIKDMTVGHLVNVLNWVHDNKESYPDATRSLLIAEAQYRQLTLFSEGKEYPQLINGKWMVMDPNTGGKKIIPPPAEYIEAVKDNTAYQKMAAKTQEKRKAGKL